VACGSSQSQQQNDLRRMAAITVASPGFAIQPGDSIAWRRDIIWAQGKNLPDTVRNINPNSLMAEIQNQLTQKGYHFVSAGEKPKYEVVAAVILGESKQGDALVELSRIYPSLGNVDELEKGTLMLGLALPGSRNLAWRSAMQAFIAEDPSLNQQKKRMRSIVSSLLKSLPQYR